MSCEGCEARDKMIVDLLDRLERRDEAGPTAFDLMADRMEGEAAAVEQETVPDPIRTAFDTIHMSDPYSGCRVVEGGEDGEAA